MCPQGHRSSSLLHGIRSTTPQRPCGVSAFSIIEILVAVAILSFCLPVFLLSRQNLHADRAHRVRLAAEAICHNTLERFGRAEDDLLRYLQPEGTGEVYVGADLWTNAELADDLGALAAGPLLEAHRMHMQVRLQRDVAEGLDLVVCRVGWLGDPSVGQGTADSVTYARHILRDENK
jgi:hypothetical protein